MAYSLSPLLKPRFFVNATNKPLVGGKLYTYLAETTTPATTYSNDTGTPNTNPIILDANGECNLYLDDDKVYRLILKDANDVTYFDKDRVSSIGGGDYKVLTFNTIADLRLKIGSEKESAAQTSGYYAAGDGGDNSFYWDGTSSAVDNGGTIIKPTFVSGAGRWLAVDTSYINVKQFGAVGDGVADDTAAIQAALNAADNNAEIFFPRGSYKVTATLTMADGKVWQKLRGTSAPFGSGGAAGNVFSNIVFSGLPSGSTGIITNMYPAIEDLGIFGGGASAGGTTVGIYAERELRTNNVTVQAWDTGISINTSYYSRINNTGFRFNALAIKVNSCFTLSIHSISVSGSRKPSQPSGNGVLIQSGSSVNFYGGSFETYHGTDGYAIKSLGNSNYVNVDGVYFEPYGDATNIAPAAISAGGQGFTLNISACTVYTYYQDAFVDIDPNAYNFVLNSFCNSFRNTSAYVSTIYKLPTSTSQLGTSTITIRDDNVYNSATKPIYITPSLTGTAPGLVNCNVSPPRQGMTAGALTDHEFIGRPVANKALSSAPANPLKGTLYWADGISWNPFYSQFSPYPVIYDGSSYQQVVKTKTLTVANNANLTLKINENAVCNTNTSAVTVTLPDAPPNGSTHTIKNLGGVNAVTVSGGARNIDSAATYTLTGGTYQAITVTFNSWSNKWLIVNKVS